jgi:hypothetical protein
MPHRAAAALGWLALGACMPIRTPVEHHVTLLHAPDAAVRAREFQTLSRAPSEVVPLLKRHLDAGYAHGFPIVALLYNQGASGAVPLELKVIHLAKFSWPEGYERDNAVIEPYVWAEIERDLAATGRPVLRLLGSALAREAPDEARAMRVARVMLQVGGAAPAALLEEFARHLGETRDLGGVRVCDVAGAAILHLAYRDVELYRAKDPAAAARERLAELRASGEEQWLKAGAEAALEASADPAEGGTWTQVLQLLTGAGNATVDDLSRIVKERPVAEWVDARAADRELVAALRERPGPADRVLERRTGVRLRRIPPLRTLYDLKTLRWNWGDPALALKWERWIESRVVRMVVAKVGRDESTGRAGVVWLYEKTFHATEDEIGHAEGVSGRRRYLLFLQSRELGTRAVVSEYVSDEAGLYGESGSHAMDDDAALVLFNPATTTATVCVLEALPARAAPLGPEGVRGDLARRCARLLEKDAVRAARALGYLGDASAAEALRKRGETARTPAEVAGVAAGLLLLGDPAGIELLEKRGVRHDLAAHELEWARQAKDERVRAWATSATPR